jgi:hypothetical protein
MTETIEPVSQDGGFVTKSAEEPVLRAHFHLVPSGFHLSVSQATQECLAFCLLPCCTVNKNNVKTPHYIEGRLSDCASFYISCNHALSAGSHSVDVSGATGIPEAERPNGSKRPAQVKSHGKPESTRRPRGEPRLARSRLHCFKSNPERRINDPAATLVLRRRVMGADCMSLTVRQDRPSQRSGR